VLHKGNSLAVCKDYLIRKLLTIILYFLVILNGKINVDFKDRHLFAQYARHEFLKEKRPVNGKNFYGSL
jgi:hypothetical protein